MQAMPISNSSPSNAPSPATSTLLPFDPPAASPFTAVFQAVLKGAGNNGKSPAAGKPQDSSREPARASGTANSLLGAFPQLLIVPPITPTLPEPLHIALAAPNLPDPGSERAVTGLTLNSSQFTGGALATAILTAAPPPAPSTGNPVKAAAVSSDLFHSKPAIGLPINTLQPRVNSPATAALTAAPPSTPSSSNFIDTVLAAIRTQASAAAPTIAADDFEPPPSSNSPTGDSQPAVPLQSTDSGATGSQIGAAAANGSADPRNIFIALPAGQAISTAPVANASLVPQDSGFAAIQVGITSLPAGEQSQSQGNSAVSIPVSTPGSKNVSVSAPIPPSNLAAPAARPNPGMLNGAALNPAMEAMKASITAPTQQATSQLAQSNLQPSANALPAPAETLAHSVAKSAAIGASTFRFHETSQLPGSNAVSPAPVTAVTAKTQSQDSSNGSLSGNSNAKPDGSLKVAGDRLDEKTFVQSLDTAGANAANGRSAPSDSTAGTAAPPVSAQIASPGAPAAAPSSADPRTTESQSAAAPNLPVVSAAHIVNQSGQTEIRIEMQADSLGGVELRAHIAGDQIGASIAVEHHDAQVALAMDLPALHSALAEKNLRLETLTVSQGHFSSLNSDPGQDPATRASRIPLQNSRMPNNRSGHRRSRKLPRNGMGRPIRTGG